MSFWLAHLALLPLCGWALVQVFSVSSAKAAVGVATWLAAAAVLHDLVLVPLYSAGDAAAQRVLHGAVNYVRVPAGFSLLLLLVYWATIRTERDYAVRWLLVTAAMFAVSALIYRLRNGGGSRS